MEELLLLLAFMFAHFCDCVSHIAQLNRISYTKATREHYSMYFQSGVRQ